MGVNSSLKFSYVLMKRWMVFFRSYPFSCSKRFIQHISLTRRLSHLWALQILPSCIFVVEKSEKTRQTDWSYLAELKQSKRGPAKEINWLHCKCMHGRACLYESARAFVEACFKRVTIDVQFELLLNKDLLLEVENLQVQWSKYCHLKKSSNQVTWRV